MAYKEWILAILQIVFNGIFVAVFSLVLQPRRERSLKKTKINHHLITDLYQLLEKIFDSYISEDDPALKLRLLDTAISMVRDFPLKNTVRLKTLGLVLDPILLLYDKLADELTNVQLYDNGIIQGNAAKTIEHLHADIYNATVSVARKCSSYFYGGIVSL